MNDELNKIPIVDIQKYILIKKNKSLDGIQEYKAAARLRNEEISLEFKYPILSEMHVNDIISYIINVTRDRKIDDILND